MLVYPSDFDFQAPESFDSRSLQRAGARFTYSVSFRTLENQTEMGITTQKKMFPICFFFSFFFGFSLFASETQCLPQSATIRFSSPTKELSETLCRHQKYFLLPAHCLKKSCQAYTQYLMAPIPQASGTVGNPFHWRCHRAGGTPLFVDYQFAKKEDAEKWQQTAICFFPDKSFISVFNTLSVR